MNHTLWHSRNRNWSDCPCLQMFWCTDVHLVHRDNQSQLLTRQLFKKIFPWSTRCFFCACGRVWRFRFFNRLTPSWSKIFCIVFLHTSNFLAKKNCVGGIAPQISAVIFRIRLLRGHTGGFAEKASWLEEANPDASRSYFWRNRRTANKEAFVPIWGYGRFFREKQKLVVRSGWPTLNLSR